MACRFCGLLNASVAADRRAKELDPAARTSVSYTYWMRAEYEDDDAFHAALDAWRADNPIEPGTVADVVDHIDHIASVAGVDHVGIGSDYDGITVVPSQLDDVSTYPVITQELLNRGWSATDIHKLLGGNALRALRRAEAVAAEFAR